MFCSERSVSQSPSLCSGLLPRKSDARKTLLGLYDRQGVFILIFSHTDGGGGGGQTSDGRFSFSEREVFTSTNYHVFCSGGTFLAGFFSSFVTFLDLISGVQGPW